MAKPTAKSTSTVATSGDSNGRKNPRRQGQSAFNYVVEGDDSMMDEEDEEMEEEEDEEVEEEDLQEEVEEEEEEEEVQKSTRRKKAPIIRKRSKSEDAEDKSEVQGRRSARSTKFKNSMTDPLEDVDDLFVGVATPVKKLSKKGRPATMDDPSPSKPKSPAIRHSTQRRRIETAIDISADEDNLEEDEESNTDDDEEGLKIQRIIACKSLTRKDWKKICDKMNTSEVDFGSRWFQDDGKGMDVLGDNTFEERFLVKWSELSYLHCSWETESDLIDQIDKAKQYLRIFFRKSVNGLLFSADERCDGDFFDPGYVQVDRILEVHLPDSYDENAKTDQKKYGIITDRDHEDFEGGTGRQFLIKWTNMTYSESSFEFERDLILNDIDYEDQVKSFVDRSKKPTKSDVKSLLKLGEDEKRRTYKLFGDNSKMNEKEKEDCVATYQKELADEIYPNGGQLRDYQAEGVSWMMANLINQRSSILADEMGLGKTLQTCSFINLVANRLHKRGPFLVIAPLSTLQHWQREFTNWTGLNTIIYHGSGKDRELIREHEFPFECDKPKSGVAFNWSYLKKCMPRGTPKLERQWMAQVVITTPELLVADDFAELTAVDWEVLVVDEAHRLKNHQSKLAVNLRDERFQFNHTLLLTGTPIQNDMKELWTLLNFIDPVQFKEMYEFLEKYGDIKSKERIDELHESIRPYILRRLKEDVEKSVPPKEETLIEVELTVLQKQYYRALYEKNVQFLHRNKKKALDGPSISNLAMQLRKCCNHPFLLRGIEEEIKNQEAKSDSKLSEGDFLVKFSGKLVLLDKLLPRLKETGHRVLIFSQFKIMLDIIEDYLRERKMKAERIDGSITGKKRQMAIDRFQAKDTDGKEAPFVMMLSTRAGGVGINLTAADTCIIFDSDWNPQNDLQAQARCHRIGQTKSVKVYRLLTRKTYEMQMFHMSSMKMGLDQAVLGGFESKDGSGEGAMTKEEVERLLRHGAYDIFNEEKAGAADAESSAFEQQDIDTILERRSKTVVHDNSGGQNNVAGSTFSKASFKAPKTPDGSKSTGGEDVDIDDPDFWKKMVGEGQVESNGLDLDGKKRTRREANYSEKEYHKQLDNSLSLSDSEARSGASDSEDSSVYSFDGKESDGSPATDAVLPNRRERAKWGKKSKLADPSQWNKSDAEKLFKGLQLYGYNQINWVDFCHKMSVTDCDVDEAKRLCWAFLLTTLREAANDEFENAKKRAMRAVERKLEEEGKHENTDSGVLGKTEAFQSAAATVDIGVCFKKLWDTHRPWMGSVLNDAVSYARARRPRSKAALLRSIRSVASKSNDVEKKEPNAVFSQNVWPALKSRGWKAEVIESEKGSTTRYVKGDQSFRSVHAVLLAVPVFHPELSEMVESIQLELASSAVLPEEHFNAEFFALLRPDAISPESLSKLLDFFAPLQLVVDRTTEKKLFLTRKVLSNCAFVKVAHDFVGPLTSAECDDETLDRIARMVVLDKRTRTTLPHPQWTEKHDAVLIFAVAKHGWIEHDTCIRSITEDHEIKWGPPFEGPRSKDSGGSRKDISEDDLGVLSNVAKRAALFFNFEEDLVSSLKGFKQELLAKSLGLVCVVPGSQGPNTSVDEGVQRLRWELDAVLLRKATGGAIKVNGDVSGPDQEPENTELPTKKELVRRARWLLAKSPDKVSTATSGKKKEDATAGQAKEDATAGQVKLVHAYGTLDQSEPSNLLLAELLRSLVKVSFNSTSKRKNMGRKLCTYALDEAQQRVDDLTTLDGIGKERSKLESLETMKKIVNSITLVNRLIHTKSLQAKNVIRFVLGLPPQIPKNPNEPIFPTDYRNPLVITESTGTEPSTTSLVVNEASTVRPKRFRQEGAIGDQAISAAMTKAVTLCETSGQSSTSENIADSTLQLTTPETLLLTVMGSQGVPVWTSSWKDVVEGESINPELQGVGHNSLISWVGMGRVFEAAAELWHTTAAAKLQQKRIAYTEKYRNAVDDPAAESQALKKLEILEQDEVAKRRALAIAIDYSNNPRKLAQKCIMLVEALRGKMGPVDSKHGAKKAKTLRRSENGLGPYVLHWFGKENARWAESFKIVDSSGKPYCYTAMDFVQSGKSSNLDDSIDIASVLDRKGCRNIFTQIAQQSRARSIFLRFTKMQLQEWVSTAVKNCDAAQDAWDAQPSWWQRSNAAGDGPNHDFVLLETLLEYGYSGIDEPMRLLSPVDVDIEDHATPAEAHLTRGAVQDRANQLTRELHMIEETAEAMKLLRSRLDVGAVAPTVQSGIESFFESSSTAKSTAEDDEVIVIESSPSASKRKVPPVNDSSLLQADPSSAGKKIKIL